MIIASLYEITRRIGSGGSGIIYLGRHLRLDKDVVLKADIRSFSPNGHTALKHEADLLKNLNHTYIPQIYDFFAEDGVLYTVMDFIRGESLDIALDRGERFTSKQVVTWGKQVLEALIYLHSQPPYGILHSDIKPANLMLTPQGDIRLIDFNIALSLGKEGSVSVGRSYGYASPEHYGIVGVERAANPGNWKSETRTRNNTWNTRRFRLNTQHANGARTETHNGSRHQTFKKTSEVTEVDGALSSERRAHPVNQGRRAVIERQDYVREESKPIALDPRSDIYGLGATLYHLLTGRRPACDAVDVQPLTSLDCPPGLAAIINKAMSPDRQARFQTAAEMRSAFDRIYESDIRSRRYRKRGVFVAAFFAVILSIGVFMTFFGLQRMEWDRRSEAFAEASRVALRKGNNSEAVELAMSAIPSKSYILTASVTPSAQIALTDALGVYDLSDGFKPFQTILLPSPPLMAALSPNGNTAALVYAFETAVIDMESGQTMFSIPMIQSALAESRFLDDKTLICAGRDGLSAYDIATGEQLWCRSSATAIAISADGAIIAAINRADDFATIYDKNGALLEKIDFEGKKQRVATNDTFVNPRDNIFALSATGRFLAVSFEDGSLMIYDRRAKKQMNIEPVEASRYIWYQGGFSGGYFIFAAASAQRSDLIVIDANKMEELTSIKSSGRFGVLASEDGVFVSSSNSVAQLDPASGRQNELASMGYDVTGFAVGEGYTLAAYDRGFAFFDMDGRMVSRNDRVTPTDILLISNDVALLGGRDSRELTVLRLQQHQVASLFAFDGPSYSYSEARVNSGGDRLILFSINGFRIYDDSQTLVCQQTIPDPARIYDQQYSKISGNLAILYSDALLIYSGRDGDLVFESEDLRSAFYTPYGISILHRDGQYQLIDPDTCEAVITETLDSNETFAAYCGFMVDSAFLAGRKLIGASKREDGYLFVISDGKTSSLYDETGRKRFDFPDNGESVAYFTETAVISAPMHGIPTAYSLKNGSKIADLEKDAHLTGISEIDGLIVCQYITTDHEHFGVLLNDAFEPIAELPRLCDTWKDLLLFDFPLKGVRCSRVYSLEELLAFGRANSYSPEY